MNDVENELRRYGRRVLDRTPPVELDDVLTRTPSPALAAPETLGRTRPWVFVAAAAFVAVAVAGVATLDQRPGDEDPVVPATEPDSLIELPRPSTTVLPDADPTVRYFVDTPIGTIEWDVVEGDSSEVPIEIIDHPDPTTVRGVARDGGPMLSTNGGRTWQRVTEPVVTSAGGHEWTTVDGQLARLTDDGIPVRVPIPTAATAPYGPWEISTHVVPDVPVDLDGDAYVAALTSVRLDLKQVITDPDVEGVLLHVGDGTVVMDLSEDSSWTSATDLELTVVEDPDSRRIVLVDPDEVTVASIDADVAGFEKFAPSELLFGANLLEWLRFDGTNFVPVETPLPPGGRIQVADLDGTALILNTTGPSWDPGPPSLWRTDGTTWEALTNPGAGTLPLTSDVEGQLLVHTTLTRTNEGVVLTTYRDRVRHDLTTDGVNFQEIELPSNASGRERLGDGWISFVEGPPAVHVSSDGKDWDRVSLRSYYDANIGGDHGRIYLIDSTIYIAITGPDPDADDLTLLIGRLRPPTG